MDEQMIRDYVKNDKYRGRWYKHDEIDMIVGACKYIETHKETLIEDAKKVYEECKPALPKYIAYQFHKKYFSDKDNMDRHIAKYAEIEFDDEDEEVKAMLNEIKEEMRATVSAEEFEKLYYCTELVQEGTIPLDMPFRDVLKEYTGKYYYDCDRPKNPHDFIGIDLNESDNGFYRIADELQIIYNRDIKGIIEKVLCHRGFYYFHKGHKLHKSFSNVNYDIMEFIVEFNFDWFVENTAVSKICYVKDIVEIDGWGDYTLEEILDKTKPFVQKEMCVNRIFQYRSIFERI